MNTGEKGFCFEREFAKLLGRELFNDKEVFWRTPSSGARATTNKSNVQTGDLLAVKDIGKPICDKYYFELKNRKLKLNDMLELFFYLQNNHIRNGKIIEWLLKTKREAKVLNKIPVLIMKINYYGIIVVIDNQLIPLNSFIRRLKNETAKM